MERAGSDRKQASVTGNAKSDASASLVACKGTMHMCNNDPDHQQAHIASLEKASNNAFEESSPSSQLSSTQNCEKDAEIKRLKTAYDKKFGQHVALEQRYKALWREFRALEKKDNKKLKKNENLKSRLREAEANFFKLNDYFETKCSSLETNVKELSILRTKCSSLETKIKEQSILRTKCSSLETKVKELSILRTKCSSLETNVKELSILRTKCSSLETKIKEQSILRTKCSSLETKVKELSILRTKWEDYANADHRWLAGVPVGNLRWLQDDARMRLARIEAEIEARKLKAAADQIENTTTTEEFRCCITQEVMRDPVALSDGHSYERSAIEEWLKKNRFVSPQTNLPVDGIVTPNHALRKVIMRHLEAQVKAWNQPESPYDPIPPNNAKGQVFYPKVDDKSFTLAVKPGPEKRLASAPESERPWRRSRLEGRPSVSPEPERPLSPRYNPGPSLLRRSLSPGVDFF